jgi:hypothetical protein
MLDGVRNSAGIEEKTGTRFGGLGDEAAAARTSRMVSSDGWTTSYAGAGSVSRRGKEREGHCGIPGGPCWGDTALEAMSTVYTVVGKNATAADKATVVLKPAFNLCSQSGAAMLLHAKLSHLTQLPRNSRQGHQPPPPPRYDHQSISGPRGASTASACHGSPTDFCSSTSAPICRQRADPLLRMQ